MINWKIRLKNKAFWLSVIPAVLLLLQTGAAVLGIRWDFGSLGDRLVALVNAVFALLTVLGIVVDPTTEGLSDSKRARAYTAPYAGDEQD